MMSQAEAAPRSGALARLTAPLQGRTLRVFLTLVVVGAAAGSGHYAWRQWGRPATRGARYAISAEKIHTTPVPDWIRTNVVEEVVRDGSLHAHSLLDPQLTIKVADAFRLHPWVRTVRRVSKAHPGQVEVDLEFRRPAALVEVTIPDARGVLPVDGDGVLLPREDFVDERGQLLSEALNYPVIVAGDSLPEGPAGAAWGDSTVSGGARIAAVFGEAWEKCGLFKIKPAPINPAQPADSSIQFVLVAKNGARVLWGAAPGDKPKDLALAKEKIERLLDYVEANHSLDAPAKPVEIDLANGTELRVSANPLPGNG
jgi:hypothetical protein